MHGFPMLMVMYNVHDPPSPVLSYTWLFPGLVGVYMAIVVLMLVNILIAMFSDTYTRIKDKEDVIFKYQRLELLLVSIVT